MEMTDQALKSDHLYGVKGSMTKPKQPMTVVTSDGGAPGSKNIVVVPSPSAATGSGDTTPAAKRPRVTRASEKQ